MRIPLLEGRDFTDHDELNTMPIMIVNESFTRRFFADRNPIGQKVRFWDQWFTVAGIVKDSKYYSLSGSASALHLCAAGIPQRAEYCFLYSECRQFH